MKKYVIGIDIGGTNTDGVLIDEKEKILFAAKTPTTDDISLGFYSVIKQLLDQASMQSDQIQCVCLGTTQATNAILQKKDLYKVGVIRIAGQRPDVLPVAYLWPRELKDEVLKGEETIGGGFECNGKELTPLSVSEARIAIKSLLNKGVESIAIVGVFSPLNQYQEEEVAKLIYEIAGSDFPVSLSCQIGGLGFVERENSTILNASLKCVMQKGFRSLLEKMGNLRLTSPLMVTQNDGSLIEIDRAIDYPILTISAGPTNSFIGGVRLAGIESGIVVDIGGTSTDIGIVRRGFPIRSLNISNIGGVALNFPMPDVLSIPLGGGSVITFNEDDTPIFSGVSVGKSLSSQAMSFGGNVLTLTDAALFMKCVQIQQADRKRILLNSKQGEKVFAFVKKQIEDLIIRIRGEYKDLPIIFVGGGSGLLPQELFPEKYALSSFYNVANAYGAALAEISGAVDTVVSLQNREKALELLFEKARQMAIQHGAKPQTLRQVDQQIMPYSYLPNSMARVVVRYCGKRSSNTLV